MMNPKATRSLRLASSSLALGLASTIGCVVPKEYPDVDENLAAHEAVIRSTPIAPQEGRTPEDRLLFIVGPRHAKGLIDTQGRTVLEPHFDWIKSSSEGRAMVMIDDLWGFVDGTGRVVIEAKWDEVSDFAEGLAIVATGIHWTHVRGLGRVQEGGQRGYIDRGGNVVIAPQFAEARPFSEGVAWVKAGEKWGVIDRTGNYLFEPRFQFELYEPSPFSEGLCPTLEGGGWNTDDSVERVDYIDVHGTTVIPGPFRGAGSFSEGLAPIVTGGKLGFIDRHGVRVIPPQFEWGSVNLNSLRDLPTFSEGLAAVRIGGRHGFVDKTGQVVIEPRFEAACCFSEGLAAVTLEEKTGFIDKEGRMVIAPQFSRVDPFTGGVARVEVEFGEWGYIRRDGTFVWHPLKPIEGSAPVPASK